MPVLSLNQKKDIQARLQNFLTADNVTENQRARLDVRMIAFLRDHFIFYNDDGEYDNFSMRESLSELLCGFEQILGFAFLQWIKGEKSWILHGDFASFKTIHAIANRLIPRGYLGSELTIVHTPQLKKPYQNINPAYDEEDNLNFTNIFLRSFHPFWNGDTGLLQGFDSKTRIILPVVVKEALSENEKVYIKNICHNYLNFFFACKELGLDASRVNIFFGIFRDINSKTDSIDEPYKTVLKAREDEILTYINAPIASFYHSEFKNTDYYILAAKCIDQMLYRHFDNIKFLLAADLVTYLRLRGQNAFVKESLPIPLAVKVIHLDSIESENDFNLVMIERMQTAILQRVRNIPGDQYDLAQLYAKFIMYYLANQGKSHPDGGLMQKINVCMDEAAKCFHFSAEKKNKIVRNFSIFRKKYSSLQPVPQVRQNSIPYGKTTSMFDSIASRRLPLVKITSDLRYHTRYLAQNLDSPPSLPSRLP